MGQQRLNSLILAAAHVDILDSLDVYAISQYFMSLYDTSRKHYDSFK